MTTCLPSISLVKIAPAACVGPSMPSDPKPMTTQSERLVCVSSSPAARRPGSASATPTIRPTGRRPGASSPASTDRWSPGHDTERPGHDTERPGGEAGRRGPALPPGEEYASPCSTLAREGEGYLTSEAVQWSGVASDIRGATVRCHERSAHPTLVRAVPVPVGHAVGGGVRSGAIEAREGERPQMGPSSDRPGRERRVATSRACPVRP